MARSPKGWCEKVGGAAFGAACVLATLCLCLLAVGCQELTVAGTKEPVTAGTTLAEVSTSEIDSVESDQYADEDTVPPNLGGDRNLLGSWSYYDKEQECTETVSFEPDGTIWISLVPDDDGEGDAIEGYWRADGSKLSFLNGDWTTVRYSLKGVTLKMPNPDDPEGPVLKFTRPSNLGGDQRLLGSWSYHSASEEHTETIVFEPNGTVCESYEDDDSPGAWADNYWRADGAKLWVTWLGDSPRSYSIEGDTLQMPCLEDYGESTRVYHRVK